MSGRYELPVIEPGAGDGSAGEQAEAPPSPAQLRTLAEVRSEYPCDSCAAYCCTHLPLHTFNVTTLQELDHALYLLNFPRIELGLSATGEWSVYYHYPCRFLDRDTSRCTIYGDELRPSICEHYNPYACWYKRVLKPTVHESFLRIDRRRMSAVVEHLTFDEHHNIVGIPDWSEMISTFAELPLDAPFDEAIEEDSVFDRWLYQAAYGPAQEVPVSAGHTYNSLRNPCDGCGAYCCKYLVFPQGAPASRVNLDYLHFVLGFPGIELGISDGNWFVIVRTTCRHLVDNRCSIYGKPERPQICTFYDAHGCEYVAQFGTPRPSEFLRIKLEQFFWLVEPMGFDSYGNITEMPRTEVLRRHVERRWHEAVVAEAEPSPPDRPVADQAAPDTGP